MPNRDFHYLDCKLLNISKDMRKNIGANVNQNLESSLQFAHAKLKIDEKIYKHNFNTQLEGF